MTKGFRQITCYLLEEFDFLFAGRVSANNLFLNDNKENSLDCAMSEGNLDGSNGL